LIRVRTNRSDCIWKRVVLILLSKHIRKNFPSYLYFQAQHIYYITTDVCSYEYGAEKILSLSNIEQNLSHTEMRAVYPYVHTLTKSMLTTSCTTACICGALSIKDGSVINILAKSLRRRTIELQLLITLHRNVKVNYSK